MKLLECTDALLKDIGLVQKKAYRLKERGRQFHDAVKCTLDLLDEITMIMTREGFITFHYEDLPENLKLLITKLKEGSDVTP